MSEAPDRDEEMLARLAEFDLAAAERVHGRLMAAEDTSEIAELGRTYQRVARSLRQTLALKAKLKRDREAAAKDAALPAKAGPPGPVAVARRVRDLRAAVTRVIWNEAEDHDFANFTEDAMEDLLTQEMLGDRFCAETLDEHVARVCLLLGLPLDDIERWRDLPDPPEAGAAPGADPPDETPGRLSTA